MISVEYTTWSGTYVDTELERASKAGHRNVFKWGLTALQPVGLDSYNVLICAGDSTDHKYT